ncbi:MAG: hypothetical protein HY720_31085 [Planctomycetes bacterium]|nr:hypothetical protein [Planctomycetota bacterium]
MKCHAFLLALLLGGAVPVPAHEHREVTLFRHDGGSVQGALVDYRPPGRYVLAADGNEVEVDEDDVEQIVFSGVRERFGLDRVSRHATVGMGSSRFCFVPLHRGKEQLTYVGYRHHGPLSGDLAGIHFVELGRVPSEAVRFDDRGRLLADGQPIRAYELFAAPSDPAPFRIVRSVEPVVGRAYLVRTWSEHHDAIAYLLVRGVTENEVEFDWVLLYSLSESEAARRCAPADSRAPPSGRIVLWDAGVYQSDLHSGFEFIEGRRGGLKYAQRSTAIRHAGAAALHVYPLAQDSGDPGRYGLALHEGAPPDDPKRLPRSGYSDQLRVEPGATYVFRGWQWEGKIRKDVWALFTVEEMNPGGWISLRWRRLAP